MAYRGWRVGCEGSGGGGEVLYRGPVGPDLPLAADLELAGAGGLWLLQVLAAVGLHCQATVGIHLAAEDLAVLHAQATGLAALGPLSDVPAGSWNGLGVDREGRWVNTITRWGRSPLPRAVSEGPVTVREPVGHAVSRD